MSKIMLLAVALIVSMSVSHGQELKITVVPPDELNSGKYGKYGMFGVRAVDSDGNTINEVPPIFASTRTGNDNGFRYAVCEYCFDNKETIMESMWLCLDSNLSIKFYYPPWTHGAWSVKDGISIFSKIYFNDEVREMGAIDTTGRIIFSPEYEDCWIAGDNVLASNEDFVDSLLVRCSVRVWNRISEKYNHVTYLAPYRNQLLSGYRWWSITDYFKFDDDYIRESISDDGEYNLIIGVRDALDMKFDSAVEHLGKAKSEGSDWVRFAASYNLRSIERLCFEMQKSSEHQFLSKYGVM